MLAELNTFTNGNQTTKNRVAYSICWQAENKNRKTQENRKHLF
jgi:hypothetical protein